MLLRNVHVKMYMMYEYIYMPFLIKKLWWVAIVWFRRVLLIAFSFLVVLQREREREERECRCVCVCIQCIYLFVSYQWISVIVVSL